MPRDRISAPGQTASARPTRVDRVMHVLRLLRIFIPLLLVAAIVAGADRGR